MAASAAAPKATSTEQGVRWNDMKPAQQASLRPLERDWSTLDMRSKRKWLELSGRFPTLTPPEQARIQERMTAWSKMTPRERGEARIHFQQATQLPAQDRQARWDAYQALSPQQKQQLAARAATPMAPADGGASRQTVAVPQGGSARDAASLTKTNVVPDPALAAPPKPVTPAVVQARPGATTTFVTKRPNPPGHQQSGLPKITATPEFVNKSTLLPQRGPQGAATRSAAMPASAAASGR